jgi:Tfp pilus assembly protein PilN
MRFSLALSLSPTRAIAIQPGHSARDTIQMQLIEIADLEPPVGQNWPALAAQLARWGRQTGASDVAIVAEPPLAFSKMLQVPPLGRKDLRLFLRRNASRFFIAAGEHVVADAQTLDRGFRRRPVRAIAAWMDQATLDAIESACREAGVGLQVMTPLAIALGTDSAEAGSVPDAGAPVPVERATAAALAVLSLPEDAPVLLPPAADERYARPGRFRSRALTWLAVALGVTALASHLAWMRHARGELVAERKELRATVDTVLRQRQALDATREMSRQMQLAAVEHAGRTGILLEVARALPDSAYLVSLSVDRDGVRLTGFARSAASLVTTLDRSTSLANVALVSSVRLTDAAGLERFDLTARLEGAGAEGPR